MKRMSLKKISAFALTAAISVGCLPINAYAVQVDAKASGQSVVQGFNNDASALNMELYARYDSGNVSADGGSMEIITYNSVNGYAYAVSGVTGMIVGSKIDSIASGETVKEIAGTSYDVKTLTGIGDTYGDLTSISVSPDGTKLAAAIQHTQYDQNGWVAIFACNADGTLTFESLKDAGVQPDNVTFAGNDIILSANEGEPRNGYGEGITDPAGTVSIINLKNDTAENVGFEGFTAEELIAKNVILGVVSGKTNTPAADLEPEYITVSSDGKTAYVSLQEANAIAVLDVENKTYKGIYSCGYTDLSQVEFDLAEDDTYATATHADLLAAKMPDGISLYETSGKTYLLTANEGDSRDWAADEAGAFCNETKITVDGLKKVLVMDNTKCAGLPAGKNVMFGSRSFTLYEVTETGLTQVYDSGSEFEAKTAQYLPAYFNCSNDNTTIDDRSRKKGPEPESVVIGSVGDKTYAYIGLERIGGVMAYDITDPTKTAFSNYINSRDFTADIAGDVSPEGLCFVKANAAGNAVLLTACEVSGTVAAYELTEDAKKPSNDNQNNSNTNSNQNNSNTNNQTNNNGNSGQNQNNAEAVVNIKKGQTYTISGKKYKVVNAATNGKGTVQFTGTTKNVSSLTIPATVKIKKVTFKVTSVAAKACDNRSKLKTLVIGKNVAVIGKSAFYNCKNLKTVTIGKGVTSIGSKAFYKCKNLKNITITSTKLKSKAIGSKAFSGISTKAKIKVPKSKLSSYKKILRSVGVSKKAKITK